MELPTAMLFLMLQEISLPVALSVIIPFYFVCIFFSLMEKGCFQYILAIVQHYLVEYIMYISIAFPHSGQFFPVQIHLGGAHVGVHRYGGFFLLAHCIPALRQVQNRFLAPVRLIPEIGIFLDFAVEGHQAFHVAGIYTASFRSRHCKVEHIPQVRSDDVGVLGNDTPLIFVCFGLERFRIEGACPVQGVASISV